MPNGQRLNPGQVTEMLHGVAGGDEDAKNKLLAAVYGDLRHLAAHLMRAEKPGHTLQPTALVNEWMSKVLEQTGNFPAQNKQHLISVAAKAMRHLLIDHARHKKAEKRGAGENYRIQTDIEGVPASEEDLLLIHDALNRLADLNERQAHVAEMRIFGGFEICEIADALQVTTRTVDRDWRFARGWLQMQLK